MKINICGAIALAVILALPVQAQNLDALTDEEKLQLLQLLLKQQLGAKAAEPAAPAAPQPKGRSETELAAEFSKLPELPSGVTFERHRDGFSVNGQRMIDPEGTIVAYGFDTLSGDYTYLAETSPGRFTLKSGRAQSQMEPVTIATAVLQGRSWTVTTETGKKLNGFRLIPSARGFIVARFNTGFRYIPGRGMTSFAAPETFSIAALQSGDISNTSYILLERTPESANDAPNGSLGALVSSIKSLGSTLGIGKKEDYALLSIDTGRMVPVNVSYDDKQVQLLSMCRRTNFIVAQCSHMESYESLFQPNGMKNLSHYFWRISWFNAQGRPVLVSQEGGLTKVSATDLNTGRKVILFDRTMGIAGFEAAQAPDGKINVTAQMGFSQETKEDVETLLDTLPDVSEQAASANSQQAPKAADVGH
jgi:hypothetical protein